MDHVRRVPAISFRHGRPTLVVSASCWLHGEKPRRWGTMRLALLVSRTRVPLWARHGTARHGGVTQSVDGSSEIAKKKSPRYARGTKCEGDQVACRIPRDQRLNPLRRFRVGPAMRSARPPCGASVPLGVSLPTPRAVWFGRLDIRAPEQDWTGADREGCR